MYTGVNLQPDAIAALSEHPNIAGMKESGNDMVHLAESLAKVREGFVMLAGSATTCYTSLALGAHGAVLALAGLVPDLAVDLVEAAQRGRFDEARLLQRRLTPLARTIGVTHGVPGLKAALGLLGYRGGPPRPPLRPVSADALDNIKGTLQALGVLEASHAAR
jgi:4-hydroxy-2-oxoglutarate aldolase